MLRKLIYIPIIDTLTDMGIFSEIIRHKTLQNHGENGLKNKMNVIEKLWTEIEQIIEDLSLPYKKVRLYEDGLPINKGPGQALSLHIS